MTTTTCILAKNIKYFPCSESMSNSLTHKFRLENAKIKSNASSLTFQIGKTRGGKHAGYSRLPNQNLPKKAWSTLVLHQKVFWKTSTCIQNLQRFLSKQIEPILSSASWKLMISFIVSALLITKTFKDFKMRMTPMLFRYVEARYHYH